MIQFKNVLCPIDFFPASERALDYAAAVAENYGAKLHVLHVVSPVIPTTFEYTSSLADLTPIFERQARQKMEEWLGRMPAGVDAAGIVRSGDIGDELGKAFQESHADLVIMGTHGRRGFERWFLGSVTERFLRRCPVPILTIGDTGKELKSPPNVSRILVTTDFSEGTAKAMDYALALAQEAPAEVTLFHVVQQPVDRGGPVEGVPQILAEHLESMVPAEVRNWAEVRSQVEFGTPYQRILEAAEKTGADLIVMNIHGKGMIDRTLLGSTAERVVRGAVCPVLSVPATAPGPGKSPVVS